MAIDLSHARRGMTVYGLDGEPVGVVVGARPDAEAGRSQTAAPAPPAGHDGDRYPLGVTTPKGRGRDTDSTIEARRGDPRMVQGPAHRNTPGAGGMDALRGYGPRAVYGSVPEQEASVTPRDQVTPAPPPVRRAELLVEDPGAFGVAAQTLHLPPGAIRKIEQDRITLDCTAAEARQRYGRRGLTIDEHTRYQMP